MKYNSLVFHRTTTHFTHYNMIHIQNPSPLICVCRPQKYPIPLQFTILVKMEIFFFSWALVVEMLPEPWAMFLSSLKPKLYEKMCFLTKMYNWIFFELKASILTWIKKNFFHELVYRWNASKQPLLVLLSMVSLKLH